MHENTHIDCVLFFTMVCKQRQRRSHINGKSTIKSLTALTMAGAMVSNEYNASKCCKRKGEGKKHSEERKSCCSIWIKKSATVAKGKSIKLAVTVNATKKAYKKVTYKVSNKQKVISVSKKRGCQRKESWNSNSKSHFHKEQEKESKY